MRLEPKVNFLLIYMGTNKLMMRFVPGGAVARILLQQPDQYIVRCLTRNPESDKAQALEKLGAVSVRGDLTVPSSLSVPLKGAWGVFGVTDFYDTVSTPFYIAK